MQYFKSSFLHFFGDLAANNSTAWFDANRKVYENEVKKTFVAFVTEMIIRIQKHEPEVQIKAADAIMRINKDIRFSKDKTPYNTYVAANISKFGRKDKSWPGFYFQLSPDGVKIFGGAYMLDAPQLQEVRKYIASHGKGFSEALNDKAFKEKYGNLQGEQVKRIPAELQEAAAKEPLIANKQFYFTATLKPEIITDPSLPDKLMEYYLAGKGMNDFLKRALSESKIEAA